MAPSGPTTGAMVPVEPPVPILADQFKVPVLVFNAWSLPSLTRM
jgi:hypothetical protein